MDREGASGHRCESCPAAEKESVDLHCTSRRRPLAAEKPSLGPADPSWRRHVVPGINRDTTRPAPCLTLSRTVPRNHRKAPVTFGPNLSFRHINVVHACTAIRSRAQPGWLVHLVGGGPVCLTPARIAGTSRPKRTGGSRSDGDAADLRAGRRTVSLPRGRRGGEHSELVHQPAAAERRRQRGATHIQVAIEVRPQTRQLLTRLATHEPTVQPG